MTDDQKKSRAVAPRPWREPYDLLWSFATAESAEDIERLRPQVARACRELRRRTYYLKQDAQSLNVEIQHLLREADRNALVDAESRKRIREMCGRFFVYKGD